MMLRQQPIAVFTALLVVLSLVGCSRVTVAYNTADFFLEHYADDYLSLDSAQLARWQPALEAALSRHRQEELPYLAAFFDNARQGAEKGFDNARTRCLTDQFVDLYQRHFRIAVKLAAPLLANLSSRQISELQRKFAEEDDKETKADAGSVARRNRKRAERYTKSAEWWTGPLTKGQKAIIREVTAAMPDTAADWVAYRSAKRNELIGLLKRGAGEAKIRRFLDDWLVEYRDLPQPLRRARGQLRDQVARLFVRLDKTFSSQQRAHFTDRLETLRDDFMELQTSPRKAPVKCSS